MAKIGIFASASGAAMEDKTPVSERSSGPATLRHFQPRLHSMGSGIEGQTMDSSSIVRVMEMNSPAAHSGTGASGGNLTIPNVPEMTSIRI